MDKEVLIHVRGLQTIDADGDQEPVEIVVPGEYFFFGDDIEHGLPPVCEHPHFNKCLRINYAGDEEEVDEGIRIIAETYRKFSK